jgi:hypothetical protein
MSALLYMRLKPLEPYLKDRRLIGQHPLKTTRTTVNAVSSRIDLHTPYHPAWRFFERIEAPEKNWLLYEHRAHGNFDHECLIKLLLMPIYGIAEFDFEMCVSKESKSHDWSSSKLCLHDFWELVQREPEGEYLQPAIPRSIINFETHEMSLEQPNFVSSVILPSKLFRVENPATFLALILAIIINVRAFCTTR